MNEYISKEAVAEIIMNAQIACAASAHCEGNAYEITKMLNRISDLSAADVVPVVRCKDCRYFGAVQTYLCNMHHRAANGQDFCSYGICMDGGDAK